MTSDLTSDLTSLCDRSEVNQLEESDHETQRALKAATSSQNTRYYCRRLELALKRVPPPRQTSVVYK